MIIQTLYNNITITIQSDAPAQQEIHCNNITIILEQL